MMTTRSLRNVVPTIALVAALASLKHAAWPASSAIPSGSPELVRTLPLSGLPLAFSPDGETLAIGGGGKVQLLNAQTGEVQVTLSESSIWAAFSPDGKTLAKASRDKEVQLWDAQTGKLKRELTGHNAIVYSAAFSPDGKTLASASGDRTVRLWDAQTGGAKLTLKTYCGQVAFSPDGKTLASGGGDDKTVRLWDTQTGKLKRTLKGHTDAVMSVAFSPDGKTLASGSEDETVRLWDAQTGAVKRTLTGQGASVVYLAFSPDGKTLASGAEPGLHSHPLRSGNEYITVRLWEARTGALKCTLTGHIVAGPFSPDGKTLAIWSARTIQFWDVSRVK